MRYDTILSLGYNCSVAAAVRGYFKFDVAYPFDWWVSHHEQTKNVLKGNFEGLHDKNDLAVAENFSTVFSQKYGIWLWLIPLSHVHLDMVLGTD